MSILVGSAGAVLAQPPEQTRTPDLKLPSVQPSAEIYNTQSISSPLLDPNEVVKQVKLPPGFEMQVVASEPDVQQPIGMSWDARGRLWIAENYTYSESKVGFDTQLSDRIIILEDTDGNGTFDQRKVFWDQGKKLTSIEVDVNGVWAMAPPYLLFIPDSNHDDVPDANPTIVLRGFDEGMRHNLANGLRFGPDGWLYGRHGILGISNVEFAFTASELSNLLGDLGILRNPFVPKVNSLAPAPTFGHLMDRLPEILPWMTKGATVSAFGAATTIPLDNPTKLHCGIWRFNPQTLEFQVVCQGTTNPWGMDWDRYGNLFFINTVIGHLWHAIPNSHMQRMYGEDLDPYAYELLPHIADHVHWDSQSEDWKETRKGAPSSGTDAAGGGHAHSGMMIYQADQWPEEYRNELFTLNFHGQRINREKLERLGAGYVGRHQPDMVFWRDPWFRGIELSQGPDGSVYVLDWADLGECHDDDGIHRQSGRIYRISYRGEQSDLNSKLDKLPANANREELIAMVQHSNIWYARWAQRMLASKFRDTHPDNLIKDLFAKSIPHSKLPNTVARIRALWALHALNRLTPDMFAKILRIKEPVELKIAALKLMVDSKMSKDNGQAMGVYDELLDQFDPKKVEQTDSLLRLYMAALLPQLPEDWRLANLLVQSSDLADDRDFPLVLWYGIKDQVAKDPMRAAQLVTESKIPKLNQLIVRRLASAHGNNPEALDWLVNYAAVQGRPDNVTTLIAGLHAGFEGRRNPKVPKGWNELYAKIQAKAEPKTKEQAMVLQSIFAGNLDPSLWIQLAKNEQGSQPSRIDAIQSLGTLESAEARETLWQLVYDQFIGGAAAQALAKRATLDEAQRLASLYAQVWSSSKPGIIAGLSSKRELLPVLVDALEAKQIPAEAIDAATWRQIQLISDWSLLERVRKINPAIAELQPNTEAKIHELEALLTDEALAKADPSIGRLLWKTHCSSCHKLFGVGGEIGPELTGSQRTNKRFWIENIISPSTQVAPNFRIDLIQLNDETVISGVVLSETDETLTVQTAKEKMILETSEIFERKASTQSLMPEGLLTPLDAQATLNLFRYLMSPEQPPWPKE